MIFNVYPFIPYRSSKCRQTLCPPSGPSRSQEAIETPQSGNFAPTGEGRAHLGQRLPTRVAELMAGESAVVISVSKWMYRYPSGARARGV